MPIRPDKARSDSPRYRRQLLDQSSMRLDQGDQSQATDARLAGPTEAAPACSFRAGSRAVAQ